MTASNLSPRDHDNMRELFLQAIGPAAILSVQPLVEFYFEKYMKVFEGYAKTGEVRGRPRLIRALLVVYGTLEVNKSTVKDAPIK